MLSLHDSTPINEIEPIDYFKITVNPPKWVEDNRKETLQSTKENILIKEDDVITHTEKVALFALSGTIVLSGLSLAVAAFFLPIATSSLVILCGIGLIFSLIGAASFETIYNKETTANG